MPVYRECDGVVSFGGFRPGAVDKCTATKPSSDDVRSHSVAQPRAQSYSVRNEFAHGTDPATVWRATQEGRRVSWLNLVMHFHVAHVPQS